jgi:hypothetical protein
MWSVEDPRPSARVVRRVVLHYRGGADAALDRPAHVRAASGLCWIGGRLAVVSDDASFVGIIDPQTGETEAITLPHAPGERRQFDTGRGNKRDKLDLESVVAIGDTLIAFGSDSGLEVRRQVAVIDTGDAVPRLVAVPRFYEALRTSALGRGHLNLEAVAILDASTLVLGNRGGDVGADGVPTLDAIARIPVDALRDMLEDPERAPVPPIDWVPLPLGELDGAPLRLTELEARDSSLVFAATAEATTTAYDDGIVTGSVVGTIGSRARGGAVTWRRVVDERGAPLVAKIEGLVVVRETDRLLVVIDADDPARPSELLEVAVDG